LHRGRAPPQSHAQKVGVEISEISLRHQVTAISRPHCFRTEMILEQVVIVALTRSAHGTTIECNPAFQKSSFEATIEVPE
jgi:hypothetical protein